MRNDFARSLLNYSAERDDCIGGPDRWGTPPVLVVGTELHDEMRDLANEIWRGPPRPIWQFLIGGPGNGKSEAVGVFVRQVNSISTADGKPTVFDPKHGKHGKTIAYDFHAQLPKGEIWLLQDVSVPKSSGSDPAADLLATIEMCLDSGGHLLACANRGMLLRATRIARENVNFGWFLPLLENIDRQSGEFATADNSRWAIQKNDKHAEIRVWPLDHESVLHGQETANPWSDPSGSLVDQIVANAVSQKNWEDKGCAQCAARDLCPMFSDALWLRDTGRRNGALKILRNAEVWSGQHLVLREVLGLVSMILVGCPSDFVDGTTALHPCDWVQKRVSGIPLMPNDELALLELVSHRIYQDLFSRASPTGLALDRSFGRRDREIPDRLALLGSNGGAISAAINRVDRTFAKQTGPLRLVGSNGILHPFDPAIDSIWCYKHSISPDGQISDLRKIGASHQGGLERELGDLFQRLEVDANALAPHKDPARVFAALYRWASVFYLRIAGTALGESPNSESLKDYLALLQDPYHPIEGMGRQTTLRELMKAAAGSYGKFDLAPSFTAELPPLQLNPVEARARSFNPRWPANDRLSLQVLAAGSSVGPKVLLPATVFVDTWRKEILQVADWNISPAMENLMRGWREDYIVSAGQFRKLPTVEFRGKQLLEFEFIGSNAIQVRHRKA